MKRLIAIVCGLVIGYSTSVSAQSFPPPIPGRVVLWGYDKTTPLGLGDLGQPIPGSSGGSNNGVLWSFPTRNVTLHAALKLWEFELGQWNGSTYLWTPVFQPVDKIAYYPEDGGFHGWLSGDATATTVGSGNGLLDCYGYDGVLNITGDLVPGSDNGYIFRLPVRNLHVLASANVWHGELLIHNGTAFVWTEVVYPVSMCGYIPQ